MGLTQPPVHDRLEVFPRPRTVESVVVSAHWACDERRRRGLRDSWAARGARLRGIAAPAPWTQPDGEQKGGQPACSRLAAEARGARAGFPLKGGVLITLEGGEGSGKSTQCALLQAWLREQGLGVTVAREPGGTPAADRLRAVLLDRLLEPLEPVAEVLLFAASRAQTVAQVIRPALAAGQVVVCDRFVDSSLAYQGFGLGVDPAFILDVNARVTGGVLPALTLLLDLPPEEGRARKGAGGDPDRIESRGIAYHQSVRAGYLALAAADPGRFCVLDAQRHVDAVQEQVRYHVRATLAARGRFP